MQQTKPAYLCIYLPSVTGHHLTYLDKVLSALNKDEKVLILTPATNTVFEAISKKVDKVIFYQKTFKSNSFIQSYYECKVILDLIRQIPVKKIIAPTGTTAAWLWPFFNLSGRWEYHFLMLSPGLLTNASYSEKLIKFLLLCLHPKNTLSTIDNASYDHPGWLGYFIRNRFKLIPDPIDKQEPLTKQAAYVQFGLQEGYFYLLACGAMNTHPRKNAIMLIKSVAAISAQHKVKLVLAGKLSREIQTYIDNLNDEQQKKFHVINRYLSDQELMDITHCADLVCALYTHHYSPSGIVMRAIKTKTPVLVPNYHWFKYMVENFNVGYLLDSLDERSVSEMILDIKDVQAELSFNCREKLLAYSSTQNFQANWRDRVYNTRESMEYEEVRTSCM
tara:strand:+ start:1607 stop:2776 length:1170 start_codon:yes stop_codon:yes gene_type:complete